MEYERRTNYNNRKALKRELMAFVKFVIGDLTGGYKWWLNGLKEGGFFIEKEKNFQERNMVKLIGMADVCHTMMQLEDESLSEISLLTMAATCGNFVVFANEQAIRLLMFATERNEYFAIERCKELVEFIEAWAEKLSAVAKEAAGLKVDEEF